MEQKKNKQFIIMAILAVTVAVMAVGFAVTAYTQALNINGNVTVKAAKWDVHFDTTSYSESQGSVQASTHSLTGTTMSYTITLAKPGDFYEATVNVVNLGTFGATMSGINFSGITQDQCKYIRYVVTYNGYESTLCFNDYGDYNDFEMFEYDSRSALAPMTGVHAVKVRVEYVQPTNPAHLPTSGDAQLSLGLTLNYTQNDEVYTGNNNSGSGSGSGNQQTPTGTGGN